MPLRLVYKENRSTPRDDSLCRSRDFRSGSMLISLKVCSIKILSISNKDTPSVPASSPPDEAYQPTLAKATHRARCLAKCFRRGAAPLVRCCVARPGRRPRVCESQDFCTKWDRRLSLQVDKCLATAFILQEASRKWLRYPSPASDRIRCRRPSGV